MKDELKHVGCKKAHRGAHWCPRCDCYGNHAEMCAACFATELNHYRAALRAVRTGYFHATLPGTMKQFDQWLAESHGIDLESL